MGISSGQPGALLRNFRAGRRVIVGRDRFAPTDRDTDRMTPDDIHDRAARVASMALVRLSRPRPEEYAVTNGFFEGPDGRRRTFDRDGRETTPGTDGAQAAPRLTRMPQGPQAGGSQSLTRAIPQPVTPAPGAPNALGGSLSVMPSNAGAPTLTRSAMDQTAAPLIRPQATAQAPTVNLTRPTYSAAPARAATHSLVDPRSTAGEMLRRADMAASEISFHARGAPKTRAQLEALTAGARARQQFWLDQAASVPGAARRIGEIQAEQAGRGQLDAATQASAERIAGTQSASRLAAEQVQQQGAMDRARVEGQFQLRRPQKPVQLADGTLAAPGPDGQMQPFTMPDGSPAMGALQRSPVDQSALARLVPSLTEQFLGADSYGMVPDPAAKNGRRPATAADRQSAYQQAVAAARETLGGGSAATPPQASSSSPAGGRPASLEAFLEKARIANPGYSDEELTEFYTQTYGAR